MTSVDTPPLVLVADDGARLRDLVRRMLSRAGFRVLTARDGAEALALVMEHIGEVDAVVSDIEMPEMDGLELRDALRATVPGLPVLLMSGSPMEAANAPSVLRKPFEQDELLRRVRDAVQRTAGDAGVAEVRAASGRA